MNGPSRDQGKSLFGKLSSIPAVGEFTPDRTQPFVIFETNDHIFIRFGDRSHAGVMLGFDAELKEQGLKYKAYDLAMGQGFTHGERDILVLRIQVSSGFIDLEAVNKTLSANLPAGSFLLEDA